MLFFKKKARPPLNTLACQGPLTFEKIEVSSVPPLPDYGPDVSYPHCDQWVLHSPGACIYCDGHRDWQLKRVELGIAFSDESAESVKEQGITPCPSTLRRSAEIRDRWPGNMAAPKGTA